jgi:hypothetical protein
MQQTETSNTKNQSEKIDAHRNQLAENLAFLIVQAHRRDQQHLDDSAEAFPDFKS